jgi:hypothetical protein
MFGVGFIWKTNWLQVGAAKEILKQILFIAWKSCKHETTWKML